MPPRGRGAVAAGKHFSAEEATFRVVGALQATSSTGAATRRWTRPLLVALALVGAGALPSAAAGSSAQPDPSAPDGPGALAHFDLARRDCLGTARNTTSKVWYTVADGT